MSKSKMYKVMLGIPTMALIFNTTFSYAQTTSASGAASGNQTDQTNSTQRSHSTSRMKTPSTSSSSTGSDNGSMMGNSANAGSSGMPNTASNSRVTSSDATKTPDTSSTTIADNSSIPGTTSSSGMQNSPSTSTSSVSKSSEIASTAKASQSYQGTFNKTDQQMIREIAYANLAEIEAGKLAQSKTQNEQVKTFSQQMIDDHTKALQDLQQIAQAKGMTLPSQPDSKHQAMMKKLSSLSGTAFDHRYMQQGGLTDHRETHRLLQRVKSHATAPELKELAARTLPTVEHHLKMAQQIQSQKVGLKSGSHTSGSTS